MSSSVLDRRAVERSRILDAYERRSRTRDERVYFGYEAEAHLLRQQERQRETLALLALEGRGDLSRATVLDVGCAEGDGLLDFARWGVPTASLAGVDLRSHAIESAKRRLCDADLRVACATEIPFESGTFDIVQQATMLSSVLDREVRQRVAIEMTRVLAPNGAIISYDTRRSNPSNPDVCSVTADDLRELFPGCTVTLRAITLLPHRVRRWPPRVLECVQPWARWLGIGQTHLLAVIRPSLAGSAA